MVSKVSTKRPLNAVIVSNITNQRPLNAAIVIKITNKRPWNAVVMSKLFDRFLSDLPILLIVETTRDSTMLHNNHPLCSMRSCTQKRAGAPPLSPSAHSGRTHTDRAQVQQSKTKKPNHFFMSSLLFKKVWISIKKSMSRCQCPVGSWYIKGLSKLMSTGFIWQIPLWQWTWRKKKKKPLNGRGKEAKHLCFFNTHQDILIFGVGL